MENSLVHSIYLRAVPMTLQGEEEGRTEEIMEEDGSASINESAKKRSMNYHHFERTLMGSFDECGQIPEREHF